LWSLGTFKTHFLKGRTCEISIEGLLLLLLPDLHSLAHFLPLIYTSKIRVPKIRVKKKHFWNPNFSSSKNPTWKIRVPQISFSFSFGS
jgi:hypothetical protein